MSKADDQYIDCLQKILEQNQTSVGQKVRPKWADGTPAHTICTFGYIYRFDVGKEFPIQTIRPVYFKKCIDEILWIWQKKSNNIKDLNSKVWDSWADKYGSIGETYGYQLRQKSIYPQGVFDQVDKVLYDLKNDPASRRIMTNMYVHSDLHKMNLPPCVYECQFNVINGKLHMMVTQRSADLIVSGGWNVTQYAILMHMFARDAGLEVGELVYVITNAHIYDRHIEIAKELITRERFPAPILKINPNVINFYDFTTDDFELVNYRTGEQVKNIPVAV